MNLLEIARKPVTVLSDRSVYETVRTMAEHGVGSVEVTSPAGELLGIFTERDLMTRVVAKKLSTHGTSVGSVMTRAVATASPLDPLEETLQKMVVRQIRHLPIVDSSGKVVGTLRFQDLFAKELEDVGRELDAVISRYTTDSLGG